VCVSPDWHAKRPGKPKVSEFDGALAVNEQVLGLEVTVQNPVHVAERYALQQLVQVALKTQK
jgi:hypothetical protein